MIRGLVFGKFMPLHTGHLALIDFALQHCDLLYIVLCYTDTEPISGELRKEWLSRSLDKNPGIQLVSFRYDDSLLPNTSVSSRESSALWAMAFMELVPDTNIVFTSEEYGDYVAGFMGIRHICFDKERLDVPISAHLIRKHPFKYWQYLAPQARTSFIKKIALVGSESTGKSTLTERLALHFNTSFVPEMARDIVEKTEECTQEDLYRIAILHAKEINARSIIANKLLFVDTDLVITKSYSLFLFNKELVVEPWIEEANRFDLYLFLEPDCNYIQDGTRLSEAERMKLSDHHRKCFLSAGLLFYSIRGNWDERFEQAVSIVRQKFF